jgi:formylmethanofuran dehydrogenase subunit B
MPEDAIIKEEDKFHEVQGEPFDSAVCPGCGCLCEDIDLTLKDGRVAQIFHACSWGLSKFHLGHRFLKEPKNAKVVVPMLRGNNGRHYPISFEEACGKAAGLMVGASRIIFMGLCQSTFDAQLKAAALIKHLGATVYPSEGGLLTPFFKAIKHQPLRTASLEEIRQLAGTIIFWGANPLHSCPRLPARYAVFVAGINAPDRQISRKVFYADPLENDVSLFGQRIPIETENELPLLNTLNKVIEEESFAIPADIKGVVDAVSGSPFVAIFAGRGISYGREPQALMDGLVRLCNTINRRTPCALIPMVSDYNGMGLYYALIRAGLDLAAPDVVGSDLRHYQPRSGDVLLTMGSDPFWFFSDEQRKEILKKEISSVSISPLQNQTTHAATVVIPVAMSGVESRGLAYRMDGFPVWLSKIIASSAPTDLAVLEALEAHLEGDAHG